jgi:transcriptional regulator with XRE-family HTH domain
MALIRPKGLFPAQLKYWRGKRGMSQLDLALAAGVSSRHVSFLETARARPSVEMVLRLGGVLQLALRDQNALLAAAGLEEVYDEPEPGVGLSGPIARALERMLQQQEPYPMIVMDRHYDVVRTNRGAEALLARFVAEPAAMTMPLNAVRAVFDPRLARPFIEDWPKLARLLLSRLHREALARPSDQGLADLVEALLQYPDVPEGWRQPEFSTESEPVASVIFCRDDVRLSFLTTVTVFNAPQNVTLEELRIESYFPQDDATARVCENAG